MNLTHSALKNPTAVVVGILLAMLFGVLSIFGLPIQLTPDISKPEISISTSWRSAAPEEIESEIIERQEDVLKGIQGVDYMESSSNFGDGSITLYYATGTNLERALIDVMNALNQVPFYPADATEPVITVGGNRVFNAIGWFGLKPLPGNDRDIATYFDFAEEVVQARIERVSGVARANVFGGLRSELRVTFDPYKVAALGLDVISLAAKLRGNTDTSGGFNDVGRRKYTLRYSGKYAAEQLEQMVLEWRDGQPIYLLDVATVKQTFQDRTGVLTLDGEPGIAMGINAETGVNVIEVMDGLKAAVAELNAGPLQRERLQLIQMYDQTVYINDSMSLVRNNLLLGMMLAIGVLWWFLRKFRATLIVAMAIPISLVVTLIVMNSIGRSLNIISMAGLAFAVGMVLDAAIVVLENIVRLREKGLSLLDSAKQGAGQVSGALIASTATTVSIFLPIAFLEAVSGQLFADLAITISAAVVVSLVIAITVIPTAASKLLKEVSNEDPHESWWEKITAGVMKLTSTSTLRYMWVFGLLFLSLVGSWLIFPKVDYLPKGNQNQFGSFILPPPGQSYLASRIEMSDTINERLMPYLSGENQPQIKHTWMGFFGNFGFMGGRAVNPGEIQGVIGAVNSDMLAGFPDTIAFAQQSPIFQGLGSSGNINVDIQGNNVETILAAAQVGYGVISQALPGANIQPSPGLTLAEPELRMIPNERAIAEAGWTRQQVAGLSQAMGTGLYIGDYFNGQRRLNVLLRAEDWDAPEDLAAIPLFTPQAGIQPFGKIVDLERTAGPSSIRRVNKQRTISLEVTPPQDVSLEEAIDIIQSNAEPAIYEALGTGGSIEYRGTAEALKEALANMSQSFILAIIILYLLMSALFRSFKDSLLVLLTIPMATIGGLVLLRITDLLIFQPLDLLTMIGFVILLGLVVNNAILLVYQTRNGEREGLDRVSAVRSAIRVRIRPILMSTLTSLCGMLPLLLIPGAGAELYRGIAAVIVGGMAVSTFFTLIFLPSLMQMRKGIDAELVNKKPAEAV